MIRKAFWFMLLVAAFGGVFYYMLVVRGAHHQDGQPPMGGLPVSVASPSQMDYREWHTSSGRLEALQEAIVKPRVSGIIEQIHFQEGKHVSRGDTLISLDTRPFDAAVKEAEGRHMSAEATLTNAQAEFDRSTQLFDAQAISQKELDSARKILDQAKGNATSTKAALTNARLNLEYAHIKAPISGTVGRVEVKVGNVVDSGFNAPTLTTIVSTDPIYASFTIDEATYLSITQELDHVKLTDIPAELSVAGSNDYAYKGHVVSFDNQLNTASGTIRVRALFDNKEQKLIAGLYANVRMASPKSHPVLLINEKAVNTDQDKKYVVVMGPKNTAEFRPIELGDTVDGLRVVRSGINTDDKIVVNGLFMMMRPGMPLMPSTVDMKTLVATTRPKP